MRLLLVDDEPAARRRLALLLEELGPRLPCSLEVVGQAADGLEALERAAELVPDVLLLDISMPEIDGFDVVRHLPEPRPLVIFQTAHDEHALRAFDCEALDYVVKPVTRQRLLQALERAARHLDSRALPASRDDLERLRQALASGSRSGTGKHRLLVRSGRGFRLVPLAEIAFFRAREGGVWAYGAVAASPGSEARPHLTDYTLKELEERTGPAFFRLSRSELVNLEAVETLLPQPDGSAAITLRDGTRLRASRRRTPDLRQRLGA